jgi:predicted nucleic acid-binding protein
MLVVDTNILVGELLRQRGRQLIEHPALTLVAESSYSHLETEARNRIPRDPDDWHTVALALEMNTAIWTQDCDFLGCGCPTWTTETLLIQLRTAAQGN